MNRDTHTTGWGDADIDEALAAVPPPPDLPALFAALPPPPDIPALFAAPTWRPQIPPLGSAAPRGSTCERGGGVPGVDAVGSGRRPGTRTSRAAAVVARWLRW